MKFFVSGKIGYVGGAREAMGALIDAGHEITFDWTRLPHLKPYDDNAAECHLSAIVDCRGVKDADVFVLLPHDRGIGMYVELGMAIAFGIPIRIVTKAESRSMFFLHPLVKKVDSIEDVISEFCSGA